MSSIHSGKRDYLKTYSKVEPISKIFSQFRGGIGGKCVMICDKYDRKIATYPPEEEISVANARFLWIRCPWSID